MVKSNYNTILSFKTVATVNWNVKQKEINIVYYSDDEINFFFTAAFDLYEVLIINSLTTHA